MTDGDVDPQLPFCSVTLGEKPHKCQLCNFTCRDVSYLSKHMLTHSDDKNYMCTECGYVTKWKHYLNVHMRKHTGDLRYRRVSSAPQASGLPPSQGPAGVVLYGSVTSASVWKWGNEQGC